MAASNASPVGKWSWIVGCLLLGMIAILPAVHADDVKNPAENPVPAPLTEKQIQLLASVQRGVIYLKATQNPVGNWGKGQHPVGCAAMPGLAMLEVGLPANDISVQRAAGFVRAMVPTLDKTYELSLAILFLNRLGDPRDVPLIQTMALRLIAGQTVNGGWSYSCPILTPQEEQVLALYCITTRPQINPLTKEVMHPYLVALPKSQESLVDPQIRKERQLDPLKKPLLDPLEMPLPDLVPKDPVPRYDPNKKQDSTSPKLLIDYSLQQDTAPVGTPPIGASPPVVARSPDRATDRATQPARQPKNDDPSNDTKPAQGLKPGPDATKAEDSADDKTPPPLNNPKDAFLAIHQWPSVPLFFNQMRPGFALKQKKDDNSNTQFAILALWASRNYRVPIELTLVRLDQRFRTTQLGDGGWSYQSNSHNSTTSMTCVGLLGLGIGHGTFQEAAITQKKNPTPPNYVFDPAIQKGLESLSQAVGPNRFNLQGAKLNLYLFWSLERVAVMYHLPTIGGVDWYTWGADLIMSRQQFNGSWAEKGYIGSTEPIDTSMALLFLSRANLNRDLSESLRRYIVVVDPARVNNP